MTPNSRVQHGELLIVYNLWLFMGSNLVTDCSILRLQLMSTKTLVTKQNKGNSAFLVGFVLFVWLYFTASCITPGLHISEFHSFCSGNHRSFPEFWRVRHNDPWKQDFFLRGKRSNNNYWLSFCSPTKR